MRPGRTGEQIDKSCEPGQQARRERIRRVGENMGVFHPIGRIGAMNRGNLVESASESDLVCAPAHGHIHHMTKTDPTLVQVAAKFAKYDVEPGRGGYVIIDRRSASARARLRPIPDTDRFELFYWSNLKGRWTTFGNFGRMKLMLDSAHEIVENDPMFSISRRQ